MFLLRFIENSISPLQGGQVRWGAALHLTIVITQHFETCICSASSGSVSSDVVNVVVTAVASISSPVKWSSSPVEVRGSADLGDLGCGSIGRA